MRLQLRSILLMHTAQIFSGPNILNPVPIAVLTQLRNLTPHSSSPGGDVLGVEE